MVFYNVEELNINIENIWRRIRGYIQIKERKV